jgi:hypothetical protein
MAPTSLLAIQWNQFYMNFMCMDSKGLQSSVISMRSGYEQIPSSGELAAPPNWYNVLPGPAENIQILCFLKFDSLNLRFVVSTCTPAARRRGQKKLLPIHQTKGYMSSTRNAVIAHITTCGTLRGTHSTMTGSLARGRVGSGNKRKYHPPRNNPTSFRR